MKSHFSLNRKMIIFVGAQGSGKTTQANLLWETLRSLHWNVCHTSLTDYTFFHLKFIALLKRLCKTGAIPVKFYEDLPPQTSPNSEIYRKLFALLVFFHFIGFTLSMAKLKFLMLSHEALIEDDGYVIKQVADLYYFANVTKMNRTSVGGRLLRALVIFLLDSLLGKNLTIIHFETRLDYLRCRYIKRKTHTEPSTYIDFQNEVYGKLSAALNGLIRGSIVKLDASNSINQVHQEVVKLIPKIEEN